MLEHTNITIRRLLEGDSRLRRAERDYSSSGSFESLVRLMAERQKAQIYEISASPILTDDYINYVRLLKDEMENMVKPLPTAKIPPQRRGARLDPRAIYGTLKTGGAQRGMMIRGGAAGLFDGHFYVDLFNGPLPDEGKYSRGIVHVAFYNKGTTYQQIQITRWGLRAAPTVATSSGIIANAYNETHSNYRDGNVPFTSASELLHMLIKDTKRA